MKKGLRTLLAALVAGLTLSAAVAFRAGQTPSPRETARVSPLLDSGPRYWKGNLHTHSLWSDGDDFPEMIADWYKQRGYHFLGLSDHNILSDGDRWIDYAASKAGKTDALKKYLNRFGTAWVERRTVMGKEHVRLKPLSEFRSMLEEPGKFLLIQAEEITHKYGKYPVHMNAINLHDLIKPIDGDSVSETIRVNHRIVADQARRTKRQIYTFLNHPNFGWGVRAEDLAPVDEVRAFEVFNGHPGVRNYGDETHVSCERMWDIVLALRLGKLRMPVVYGVATDDSHAYHVWGVGKVNPGRGWVMVRAPYLTAEAIVKAMEVGDFYCSTGVTLREVKKEGGKLTIAIQGERGVSYRTEFIATMKDAPLTATPQQDKDKKPVTGLYSPEIGKVVAESRELVSSYQFTGKELYVRVRITSSKAHPNPYQKGDTEVAWTQPFLP